MRTLGTFGVVLFAGPLLFVTALLLAMVVA